MTKLERIRNGRIRATAKVGEISKKVGESGTDMEGDGCAGKRRKGRPKRRWMDSHIHTVYIKKMIIR